MTKQEKKVVEELKAEIQKLKEQHTTFTETSKLTVEELNDEIKELETEKTELLETNEELLAKIEELRNGAEESIDGETETMYWVYPVQKTDNNPISFFGLSSTESGFGHHAVEVPVNRVKSELARKGRRLLSIDEYNDAINSVKKEE